MMLLGRDQLYHPLSLRQGLLQTGSLDPLRPSPPPPRPTAAAPRLPRRLPPPPPPPPPAQL